MLSEALAAARVIAGEDDRTDVLIVLVPHLPPADRVGVLGEALAAARAIAGEDDRARALAALAPRLAETRSDAISLFAETLRYLARHGRPALLHDLAALAPWIVALGEYYGQPAVAALVQAILDVRQCWG